MKFINKNKQEKVDTDEFDKHFQQQCLRTTFNGLEMETFSWYQKILGLEKKRKTVMSTAEKLQAIHDYYYKLISSKKDLTIFELRFIEKYLEFMIRQNEADIAIIELFWEVKQA